VSAPLISLRHASVAHRDGIPPALHDVSLDVHRGDWIAIAGNNGSGKTTLLAALGGVLPLRAGTTERTGALRAALLLQEPDNQLVASTVGNELALSVPRDVDDTTRHARIAAAIERFDLGGFLGRNPHRLSGGEKQRLAFATVWLEAPDVLLLDEPLSFLDAEMRERVIAFVRTMNAAGTAVVWATPGADDVELARTAIVLENGRVTCEGVSAFVAARLKEEAESAREPASAPHNATAAARATTDSARVRFESVSFSYGKQSVIVGLDLDVAAGECVGIAGPNGSGKSTLLLLAGGALAPASGRITRVVGENGVLYLPQSPERLFFAETVIEEITFGLKRRGMKSDSASRRAEDALNQVGLEAAHFVTRSPFELSFGEMRRVAFAIAWAMESDLLLLDEPASCLDANGRVILDRLVASAAGRGAGVVIASHDNHVVHACDRVVDLRHTAPAGRAKHAHADGLARG